MFKKSLSLILALLFLLSSSLAFAADDAVSGDVSGAEGDSVIDEENPGEDDSASEESLPTYTVTLLTYGGGVVEASQTEATEGTTIKIIANPQTGYVFYNWSTSSLITLESTTNYVTTFVMPASDVKIIANFVQNPLLGGITGGTSSGAAGSDYTNLPTGSSSCTITFDTQGGSYVAPINVSSGTTANAPTPPTCDGYVFNGWTTDPAGKNLFNFGATKIYDSMTLFAQWVHESQAVRFSDLTGFDWAEDAIYNLFVQGIITGTSRTTYAPGKNITRADFITLIVRAFGFSVNFTDNFSDVSSSAYYYNAVGIAKALGIATGSGANKFNPTAPITRQDIMVIIQRVAEKAQLSLSPVSYPYFTDMNDVSAYAKDAVELLTQAEIITGANDKINPKNYATRAEVAVILDRLLKK